LFSGTAYNAISVSEAASESKIGAGSPGSVRIV
jgi:hypothetical protein